MTMSNLLELGGTLENRGRTGKLWGNRGTGKSGTNWEMGVGVVPNWDIGVLGNRW